MIHIQLTNTHKTKIQVEVKSINCSTGSKKNGARKRDEWERDNQRDLERIVVETETERDSKENQRDSKENQRDRERLEGESERERERDEVNNILCYSHLPE